MSKKILLADDSVTIQKVVELTFMDEGVTVIAVGNGSDAIARLAEVNPDVVIADVHMPGASGYEVSRKVKDWRPGIPVLLLVGTFEPFSKEEFIASGANSSMKKPFDSQELLREVTEMLALGGDAEPAAAADDEGDSVWQLEDTGSLSAPSPSPAPAPVAELAHFAPEPPAPIAVEPVFSAPAPQPTPAVATPAAAGPLSEEDIDRIARRVVDLIGDRIVREVSWEVIPDLAEVVIKDRLRELESQVE